jgi:arylsulfatase A-like enzyme
VRTSWGGGEDLRYSNAQGSTGPFRGRKRSLYEGGTRVPSFAVWGGGTPRPQIPAGAVEHTVMSATDWLPTVAAGERLHHISLASSLSAYAETQHGSPFFPCGKNSDLASPLGVGILKISES